MWLDRDDEEQIQQQEASISYRLALAESVSLLCQRRQKQDSVFTFWYGIYLSGLAGPGLLRFLLLLLLA